MDLSSLTTQRWVIDNMDREIVQLVKEIAARHAVRICDVMEQAVLHFDDDLGRTVELPMGWRRPRDW